MRTGTILLAACVLCAGPAGRADDLKGADELMQMADKLAKDKKPDEAFEAAQKAAKLVPSNDRAQAIASEYARRAGRFAEGLELAHAAIKLNDKVGVYHALAMAHAYGLQDLDEARRECQIVLDMGPSAGADVLKDVKLMQTLLVPKTYTITWSLDPSRGAAEAAGVMNVALPKNKLPYQSVKVQVKGAKSSRIVEGEVNDLLRVVPDGKNTFQVITTVTVTPISFKDKLTKADSASMARDASTWLGAAETFDPTSPKLRKQAAALKGKTPVETVRNVLQWMHKNVEYKLVNKSVVKHDFSNVEEILDRGHAECRGQAMLFTALCRAAGVPARPVWGVAFLPREQGGFSSHNWDEVLIPGAGWVPVDPQKPESFGLLPTTHMRMYMDLKRSAKSQEHVPVYNLLYMNGEKLDYEESSGK